MDALLLRLPEILSQLIAFALAISVHESAHAWMADRHGDPTARMLGRITLNPIKHVDPIGTVLFPLMLAVVGAPVFGWAKPVPVVSRNLKDIRRGWGWVAVAGPASNLALAAAAVAVLLVCKFTLPGFRPLLATLLQTGAAGTSGVAAPLVYLLFSLALVNLVLAVFNMIPIPPADGSKLVMALLPPPLAFQYAQLERWGFLIFIALLWIGAFGWIFRPFVTALVWILLT
ncbi:MAG: site-2 protease family protein [Acidobacteriota bacterium]|jgi:Zn-dependent protease